MTGHVAVVTDTRYLPWAAVVVRSVIESDTQIPLVVHVLHDESVGSDDRERLAAMSTPATRVEPVLVDAEALQPFPDVGRFGRTVWIRCLLQLLFPDLPRILYLDADTLVTAPLDPLLDVDLRGAPLGAVNDVIPERHWARVEALGLAEPTDYFNSGVLLFDLDALRREDVVGRIGDLVEALGPEIHYPDQDVLNLLFPGRWHRLHPRFNAQNRLFHHADLGAAIMGAGAREEAVGEPVVVHFEGPDAWKPWHAASIHPRREHYRAVLGRTPWADTALVDDTVFTRALQRLPEHRRWGAYYTWRRLRDEPWSELGSLLSRLRPSRASAPMVGTAPPVAVRLRPTVDPSHVLHGAPPEIRTVADLAGPFCPTGPGGAVQVARAVEDVVDRGTAGSVVVVDDWRGGTAVATVSALGGPDRVEVHLVTGGPRRSPSGPLRAAYHPAGMARVVQTAPVVPTLFHHRSAADAAGALDAGPDTALAVTTVDPGDAPELGRSIARRLVEGGLLVIDSPTGAATPPGFARTELGDRIFRRSGQHPH